MKNYYNTYFLRYLQADTETRTATKIHWIKCHTENLKSGRNDLIIFSSQILAAITMAENELEKRTI